MISFIKGKIIDINNNIILIENNGIGYEVACLQKIDKSMPVIGDTISLYILSILKDDGFSLYGFSQQSDKELVKRLIKIPGIGIKNAMNILSNIDHSELFDSIQTENIAFIQKIPGIGKKTAQRIITELKEEIPKIKGQISLDIPKDSPLEKVSTALLNLGFKQELIQEVLQHLRQKTKSNDIPQLIKESLSIISGMRK